MENTVGGEKSHTCVAVSFVVFRQLPDPDREDDDNDVNWMLSTL